LTVTVVSDFLEMARGELDDRLLPILRTFTPEQLGFIADYLQEMHDRHYKRMGDENDAACALRLFWGQFKNPVSDARHGIAHRRRPGQRF
jgi:hypothetical protein